MTDDLLLDKLRMRAAIFVSEREAVNDIVIKHRLQELAYSMSSERIVLALKSDRLKIDKVRTAQVPATAWGAFREALGWRWLLRCFPVEHREVRVEIHVDEPRYSRVCPHLDVSDNQDHYRFLGGPHDER